MLFDITTEKATQILYAEGIPPGLQHYAISGARTTVVHGSFGAIPVTAIAR